MENTNNGEINQTFERFGEKLEALTADAAMIELMAATMDNCIAFLKEKELLDEFTLYLLKKGVAAYAEQR